MKTAGEIAAWGRRDTVVAGSPTLANSLAGGGIKVSTVVIYRACAAVNFRPR